MLFILSFDYTSYYLLLELISTYAPALSRELDDGMSYADSLHDNQSLLEAQFMEAEQHYRQHQDQLFSHRTVTQSLHPKRPANVKQILAPTPTKQRARTPVTRYDDTFTFIDKDSLGPTRDEFNHTLSDLLSTIKSLDKTTGSDQSPADDDDDRDRYSNRYQSYPSTPAHREPEYRSSTQK